MRLITFIFILLLVGCGDNAHITDTLLEPSENNPPQITPPVTPPPVVPPVTPPSPPPYEMRSYMGSDSDGLAGDVNTGFIADVTGTGTASVETFDSLIDGTALSLTNTIDGVSYTAFHNDDDGGLGTVSRNIYIESPASQGGASSTSRGLDLRFGSNSNLNMFSISFDAPIAHFGIDTFDFESSSAFTLGTMRTYNCATPTPVVVHTINIDFGAEDGDGETHFVGFSITQAEICHVTVSVGDDGVGGGLAEKFALDTMRFGTATLVP